MRKWKIYFVLLAVIGVSAAHASSEIPAKKFANYGVKPTTILAVEQGILSTWSSSRPCPEGEIAYVQFLVADDGKVYEPQLSHSSGDDQYDAECLESVCMLTPLPPNLDNHLTRIEHCAIEFGGLTSQFRPKPRFDGKDITRYLLNHPQPTEPRKKFVLIHRIPLAVLNRYPGAFSEAELLNADNLIEIQVGLRPSTFDQTIGNIGAHWGVLFKKEKVSSTEILDWAKRIDQFVQRQSD